jgi:4'-phosphopantetheinyl transferase
VRLEPDTCQLWRVDLTSSVEFPQILDVAERERAARFRFDDDRRRFVASHVALRCTLGHLLDRDPRQISFRAGQHGRPSLATGGGLEFNMSHSGDLALIAVSRVAPIGVDIEVAREVPRALDLARRFLHPDEASLVEQAAMSDRSRVFLTCWSRKEAVLKSTGIGLTLDTRTFDVGATAEEKVLDSPRFPRLRVISLEAFDGYVAACAVPLVIQHIEFARYAPLMKNRAP